MTEVEARGGSASIAQADYWWYRVRGSLLHTVLLPFAAGAADVLDVGSADGPSVSWLRGERMHITLDVDPRGLVPGTGVCGSALQLPFADESFDVVGAFDVIEHCEPEGVAIAEMARVLRPGGRLLMSVPAYRWAWSDFDEQNGHYRRYTRRRATTAVEAGGLEVLRSTYAFTSTFPFFAAERLARRTKHALSRSTAEAADIVPLPQTSPGVDRLLSWLGGLDGKMLARRDLPFGSSVVVAARKPER
ncbi:class I SAM-dependent methyltransferase [Nocardioides panacihumi]|uniref:class I SAM-dependent methyltransferase n=1 Tax=Nocardioides panacihumi TaxID=400774 RepID=UPI0031DE5126